MTGAGGPGGARIVVVGLGPGPLDQLSLAALRALRAARVVYLRTARHPTVAALESTEGRELIGSPPLVSCDDLYEAAPSFADVYDGIVARLLAAAEAGPLVYAVPGHPLVAERSVQALRERAAARGLAVEIVGSASCVEAVCQAVGADAAGLQLADALDLDGGLSQPSFPAPWAPLLVLQVYSRRVASDVKLALLRHYPPDHPLRLVLHAGLAGAERVLDLPLRELDRNDLPDHLCTLWVPPVGPLEPRSSLRTLEVIVARLRAPDGCPWDREQTHHTIKRNLLEETYELLEALDAEDYAAQTEELGDLLMQVFLHSEMARQAGEYDLGEVTAGIADKLVRRHPHVFGDVAVSGAEEVLRNWDAIKKQEGKGKVSVLEGLPHALPALTMALALSRRAATAGFTWPDPAGAHAKVEEELGEFRAAASDEERRRELGDLLFALTNLARMLGDDAEECLRAANRRFRERFAALERLAGSGMAQRPLEELLALWRQTA